MPVTLQNIRAAVQDLGLSGSLLCVHSAMHTFGRVEGGAMTVVQGLLAERCTVLVPTFSWSFAVPPPPDMRPPRNGWDYEREQQPDAGIGRVYTSESQDIDQGMGAIPRALLGLPERVRGNHPLCSFAGVGPLAADVLAGQSPADVYAPLRALAERGGFVVLMGVSYRSLTLLHLAEQHAGRTLFRRWANDPEGHPMMVESGACSSGFDALAPTLAPIVRERRVGRSLWRILPARETVELAAEEIRRNPRITHCGRDCPRCDDAVLGGPSTAFTTGSRPTEPFSRVPRTRTSPPT